MFKKFKSSKFKVQEFKVHRRATMCDVSFTFTTYNP